MRCAVARKPNFWLWTGGFTLLIGLAAFVISIVVKTVMLKSVQAGLYKMRFLDNTHQVNDCEHFVLGDATCPGRRFEAWSMGTDAKYSTCMHEEAPVSKSLSAASKWCAPGEAGCTKPEVCKPGEKHSYHFFSVLNPLEVLNGEKADLAESEPVSIIKSVDKVQIDSSRLESEGTIEWKEAYRYSLANPMQNESLSQKVVVANAAMFATITKDGKKVTADAVTFFIGAAVFYTKFQERINAMTSILPFKQFFTGKSAINFSSLVKDQFREAKFTLALGEILASEACPLLVPLLSSAIPAPVAVKLMCHSAYRDNIGISAFSALLLSAAKLRVSPTDSVFFYEYEKGCRTKSDRPSLNCYLSKISEYTASNPTLAKDLALSFLAASNCRLSGAGNTLESSLCGDLIAQLMLVGRAAVTVNNPQWSDIKRAYGWHSPLDSVIASKIIPYFIKGSVGRVMGFGLEKPVKDPLTGAALGPQLWVNSLSDSPFVKGPFVQQVSSLHGDKGLNYFVSVNGKSQSCAFDFGCMSNPSFDGHTCKADAGVCRPETVEGHGQGCFPGKMFGGPISDTYSMFLPEMFVKGDFKLEASEVDWIENLHVDKYIINSINFNLHACNSTSPSRGVDCDSPIGTKNVGFHASYDAKMDPRSLHIPLYASFPYFHPVVPLSAVASTSAYDPMSKLRIKACESCPSHRSFISEIWTEPQTGAHVYGSQKLQLNVRLQSSENKKLDILLPVFWVDRADAAARYQAAKLASIQSIPRTFNIIFGVLLAFGLLVLLAGAFMVRKGLAMRRAAMLKDNTHVLSDKRRADETDRSSTAGEVDSFLESKSSSGPKQLTSV